MADKTTEDPVTGHIIKLDETRLVFLGEHPDKPDTWFMGFRNSDGKDTKLTFSREALSALVDLATNRSRGERVTFPHKRVWRVVTEGEVEAEFNV